MDNRHRRHAFVAIALLAAAAWAQTPAADGANMVGNPGFEETAEREGVLAPVGWHLSPAAGETAALALDEENPHTGRRSLRMRHERPSSYTKASTSVRVRPGTDYAASVWVKVDWDAPLVLDAGAANPMGARMLILPTAGGAIAYTPPRTPLATGGRWRRLSVRFNSGPHERLVVLLYLHRTKGTIYFDDAEVVEGDAPGAAPEREAPQAPFPLVDFMPGTASLQNAIYLNGTAPAHLHTYYQGPPESAEGLEMVMDLPPGIFIRKQYAAAGADHLGDAQPAGAPLRRDGQEFTRYVLPVPPPLVRPSFAYRSDHVVILQSRTPEERTAQIRWRLRRATAEGPEREMALTVLPALPPIGRFPEHFEIFTFYNRPAYLLGPEVPGADELFAEMLDLHANSGLMGCLLPQSLAYPAERVEQMRGRGWQLGVLQGWVGGHARAMIRQARERGLAEEFQVMDPDGKPVDDGHHLCSTWVYGQGWMADLARRGLSYYNIAGRDLGTGEGIWYVFDYEPSRRTWRKCYCPRCLAAFADHAGIPAEGLTGRAVVESHQQPWREFRDWQNGEIVGQFSAAVRERFPQMRIALCDGPSPHWSRTVYNPYIDFHAPMIYYRHPKAFFDEVKREAGLVERPLIPTIDAKMGGYAIWTSPQEMRAKTLSIAALGGRGVMLWPGLQSLSGLDLQAMRECSDFIAEAERFYFGEGRRVEGALRLGAPEGFALYDGTLHQAGEEQLITLFNFHSAEPAELSAALAEVAGAGPFRLHDPVRSIAFLTPARGTEEWRQEDLAAGFQLALGPGEVRCLLLAPANGTPPADRAQRLGPAGKMDGESRFLLDVPRLPPRAAIAIDGLIQEEAWRGAALAGDFMVTEAPADAPTNVRLLHDERHLYIAFDCGEPRMAGLQAEAQGVDAGRVFRDDCVEVFLRPAGSDYYFQFGANSLGTRYDARVRMADEARDAHWASGAKVAAERREDGWSVEWAIPFAALGAAANPGEVWQINLCRQRKASPEHGKPMENSSWFPAFDAFVPPKFGQMRFLGE